MRGLGKDIGDFITGLRRRKSFAHLEDNVRAAIVRPSHRSYSQLYPGASPEIIPGLTPQQLNLTVNSPGVAKLAQPRIVLNTNPVTVGTSPVLLAQQYTGRKILRCQNTGTTIIYLGFGFSPTGVNYTYALAPGSAANDGTGVSISDSDWQGNVWALSSAAGGTLVFNEEP